MAQPLLEARFSQSLRVLSFNVNMLPHVAGRGRVDLRRAEKIVEALADEAHHFDLICLQEVFTDASRDIFSRELAGVFPHQVARCCPPSRFWTASGLFFASRFPIVSEPRFETFREYATLSSDAFAMKGVFGVKVDISSTLHPAENSIGKATLCVFNTHLQSAPRWRNQRMGQLDHIRRFMLDELDGMSAESTSMLLCGDMNVAGEIAPSSPLQPTEEYGQMMQRLGTAEDAFRSHAPGDPGFTWDGSDNAWIPSFPASAGAPERLDYVLGFGRAPDPTSPVEIRRLQVTHAAVEKFGSDRDTRLSDHFAVSATFGIEANRTTLK
ncbi:MAG: sphingomyelin phosphodiesterase [Polyangiaceae bacterium]